MKTIVNILTGDQGEVKKFILANVDINCRDRNCKSTPLHMAAKGNHIEVVETLLKHGADITLRDVRKYFTLCVFHFGFFLLLSYRSHTYIQKEGETPLHEATDSNAIHVAEILIQKGAPLDVQDEMGWSALHNAAGCGDHPEIVSLLLKAGANRHLKTKSGETALDLAVKNEHPKAEKLLKEPSP